MSSSQSRARGYLLTLILLSVGSAVTWWAMSGTWVKRDNSLLDVTEGSVPAGNAALLLTGESITGGDVSAMGSVAPLIGLAAVAGIIGSRGFFRRLIGVFVVLLGLAVVWSAFRAWISLASQSGVDSFNFLYPIAAVFGGAALAVGGALTVFRGTRWPTLGSSYERSTSSRDQPKDAWEALDRGLDPTSDDVVDCDEKR
jgi:hypothetical protein